jgi:hypothetical protein
VRTGSAFDPSQTSDPSTIGRGMRHRISLVAGQLAVGPLPAKSPLSPDCLKRLAFQRVAIPEGIAGSRPRRIAMDEGFSFAHS